MKAQIGLWGNSLAVRIPKYVAEALNLQLNDTIDCSLEDGRIVLQPLQDLPELSLDELLAEVSDQPETEMNWGTPVGEEVW